MRRSYVLSFPPPPSSDLYFPFPWQHKFCLLLLFVYLFCFLCLYLCLCSRFCMRSHSQVHSLRSAPFPFFNPILFHLSLQEHKPLLQFLLCKQSLTKVRKKKTSTKNSANVACFQALGSGMGIPATVFSFFFCFDCLHAGVCVCVRSPFAMSRQMRALLVESHLEL